MPTGRVKHVTATTLTFTGAGDFDTDNVAGKNLHFGIREHAMVATVNGLSLSKLRAYGATFFIFSDYARPAIRLSALMELPTIFIFTHDAMGDGEDGPTHQSVEHLASLRAIPGLVTLRPGDANEVLEAYRYIMQLRHQPAVLAHCLQCGPCSLLRRGPVGRKVLGASDLGEFIQVPLGPAKLVHALVNHVSLNGVGRIVEDFSASSSAGAILLLAYKHAFMLVDILPAEHFLRRCGV